MIVEEPIWSIAPFRSIDHQSSEALNPLRKRGWNTTPADLVVAVSGKRAALPPTIELYPPIAELTARTWPYCVAVTPVRAHSAGVALGSGPTHGSRSKKS